MSTQSPPTIEKHSSNNSVPTKEGLPRHHTSTTAATTETANDPSSQALPFSPYTVHASKVLDALNVDDKKGLSEDEAARRLEQYGLNRLKPPKKPSLLKITAQQTANAMTLVLSE